jgi:uncharacterized protein YfaS (alpha-2-macroglobulin family)
MKSIIITLSILMGLFTNDQKVKDYDFEKAWKEVEKLNNEGLPESALIKTEEIYEAAVSLGNQPQIVKSLIHIARNTINTDEKGIDKSLARFEKEINLQKSPVNRILASYHAELYQKYFDNHRWEVSQRTELDEKTGTDFRTWTTQQFLKTIEKWYLFSLENKKELEISIENYKDIAQKFDKEATVFRPTLYEVLTDRALDFFNNYQNYSPENSSSFQVDREVYFAEAESFVKNTLPIDDQEALSYKVLKLYLDITQKQWDNKQTSALIDYELKRLEYVHSQSTLEKKDELYLQSLKKLANKSVSDAYHTVVAAKIAERYLADNQNPDAKVDAMKVCEEAIKKHPKTRGADRCRQIIQNIKTPQLQLSGEQVYPSGKDILFAIDYNNIGKVNIEVAVLPSNITEMLNTRNQEEWVSTIRKAKKVQKLEKVLAPSKKYASQKTEINVKGLPYGKYALLVSSLDKDAETFQYLMFDISDLAYTSYLMDGKRTFVVVNRVTGAPVKEASIELFQQNYNPASRRTDLQKSGTYKTNAQGIAKVEGNLERNFKVIVTKSKDKLDINQFIYNYVNYQPEPTKFAEFYTDRAIYRPGQTLHYKTLLIANDKDQVPSLIKNQQVRIILKDANYQEVSTQEKVSNDYGSIHGHFVLPEGRLNGSFTIEIQSTNGIYGQKNIQVEEYKRPTFEVKTNELTGEPKLGQTIAVTGNAMTLAGIALDNAEVKYSVTRRASFPYWCYWWRIPASSPDFVVKNGTTTTDGEGNFTFNFDAIPDLKLQKKDKPVFNYEVNIDITDQRGETRSASRSYSLGYDPFSLTTEWPNDMDMADIKPLKIVAKGISGNVVNTKGNVEIIKLKEPDIVQVNKYWNGNPDHPIPLGTYKKIFPYFPVAQKNDYSSWAHEKVVYSGAFDTQKESEINPKLAAGVYKIVSNAKSADNQTVDGLQFVVITDFGMKVFPKTEYLFVKEDKAKYAPGETFGISLGTPEPKIHVYYVIEKDGKELLSANMKVDKVSRITLPITEKWRGGATVKLFYVKQNRWFEKSVQINVPWTNKDLQITFETFRDKTMPGSKESYKVKISGAQKDKVMAELLASMYDASLDQFAPHYWRKDFYPSSYGWVNLESAGFRLVNGQYYQYGNKGYVEYKPWIFPALIPLIQDYGYYGGGRGDVVMMKSMRSASNEAMEDGAMPAPAAMPEGQPNPGSKDFDGMPEEVSKKTKEVETIQVRKNLKETVFFFPEMKTDADGNVIIEFTINEALTKWKLMTLAHTTDFKIGYDERTVLTQKDLMIFPNAPRFVRDGDVISFAAKVSNLSDQLVKGKAQLQIWDAITMRDITAELVKSGSTLDFNISKGNSQGLTWEIKVPETKYQAITYRVSAATDQHTDAEESTIPVVTNKMLVTETMPFWIPGNSTRSFTFNAFKNNLSKTKSDYKYTLEYTASPVWYAVQALPYMQETSNISTQALIDRLYANLLASTIVNAHPKMKAVFDQWKSKDKDALVSNLSKNEELKSAILAETPWVRQALSETEQKKNIALLFDLNTLANQRKVAIQKLQERQLSNGGFPWLSGGRDNVYTTQQIMENIGHLYRLGALQINDPELSGIITKALGYMDNELADRYERLQENIKKYGGNINDDHLDDLSVHYLYIKTFFGHVNASAASKEARDYYFGQSKKYWLKRSLYTQAMIGLIMHRNEDPTHQNIVKSLRERSTKSDEMGIYWNEGNGFYWYQLPIERHALLVELFSEAGGSKDETERMKIWLLKNKQTNHWKTSKSTAAAIYALLIQGEKSKVSDWITESSQPVIMVGSELINTSAQTTESGTGYIKKSWATDAIKKDMSTVKVTNNNKSIAWGAAYYQYFEQLDQIKTFADTPLKLTKKLYKSVAGDKGLALTEITDKVALKPGDKVVVRIELRVDRDMEYVHMKDMRVSGFEPVNVISEYKYQGALGYYEVTKDMATHFYFGYLPKGTFVFEYPVRIVHKGDFSAGITNIECMYAPEFASHSEGVRVVVK